MARSSRLVLLATALTACSALPPVADDERTLKSLGYEP